MKYSVKDYAKALVATKKFNMQNFLHLLKKNGDTKKLKHIVAMAENIMLAKTGNKKIMLETARPLLQKISIGKKGDVIDQKVNPDLIAGMKVIVNGEKQLDISLKNILDNIF